MKKRDLTGLRFGRLVVIEQDMSACRPKHIRWMCRCDCGKTVSIQGNNLRSGTTRSCGCLRAQATSARRRTHGKRSTPEYRVWYHIKDRCHTPRDATYRYYGARGITMCERWRTSFDAFWSDMGPRPSPYHQIERKDNDGPYSPDNCTWATKQEQANNKRSSHLLTHDGRTMTVAQWARTLGMSRMTLKSRLQYGWSAEKALTAPVRPWGR